MKLENLPLDSILFEMIMQIHFHVEILRFVVFQVHLIVKLSK